MADSTAENTPSSGGFSGKEFRKAGYSLFVTVTPDKIECRCSYLPRQDGAMMTRDELRASLTQSLVRHGIDEKALDEFAVKAAAGIQQANVLIASGVPPINGVDGHLDYLVKASQEAQVGAAGDDETARIDMHAVQTFINVAAGENVARIIPPTPGTPGRSIVGAMIHPVAGRPLQIKIGKNLALQEEGNLLVAEAAGRLCVASGEISVEEVYSVKGDVDFRVGSIVFNGVVSVSGDVLDDFNVYATKGIRITGNAGLCHIRSGGDISMCGMDGQDKGTIHSGGTLRANFLHNCVVECAGDVIIDVEIYNCTIRSLGRVTVNKGAIAGGSCTALGGIEAKKIGSAASVRTKLKAGVNYLDEDELHQLATDLEKNQSQMEDTLDVQRMEELRKQRAGLTDRVLRIRSRSADQANPKISARATLYDNTVICVGSICQEFKEQVDGPVSMIENTIEGGLRVLSMTSLDVKASDIELAFIREQSRN